MLESEDFQVLIVRFIMANIDIEKFADFLEKIDSDSELFPIDRISEQEFFHFISGLPRFPLVARKDKPKVIFCNSL